MQGLSIDKAHASHLLLLALQIPIWQLAGPAYSYTSREERKAQLAQLGTQQQQQQLDGKFPAGVIAGIALAVVGAVLLVGVGLFLAVQKLQQDSRDQKVRCRSQERHYAGIT